MTLQRLFRPATIAVVGGGVWCESVVRQCRRFGFSGSIWPVHPAKTQVGGEAAYGSLEALPAAPDAVFVGINRTATVQTVGLLAGMGAGGAVCFASGFREATAELADGGDLETAMVTAAQGMPVLGPNCYGFINALDGLSLWPDQHGLLQVDRGVAIIGQSSNVLLNLTMHKRGLPIGYLVAAGNQAQTGVAELGQALLADARVTALGLHLEGVGDLAAFETLAEEARRAGKPIVVLKAGASDAAQAAAVSHTASMVGSEAGAAALFERLGMGQVYSLGAFVETLKLLHVTGPLTSSRIASASCSGGEASLIADSALGTGLEFPTLNKAQSRALRAALGPKVALANPLDYHTYIWEDQEAMTACYSALLDPSLGIACVILDFPRSDRCDPKAWLTAVAAAADAQAARGVPMAIVSSLPETMPEEMAEAIMARWMVPLQGLDDALTAMAVAARIGAFQAEAQSVLKVGAPVGAVTVSEVEAKEMLAPYGVPVPQSREVGDANKAATAAEEIGFPVVVKGAGLAHKTEAGAVALNLSTGAAVKAAAGGMNADGFLVEEMVTGTIAELLVSVIRDPAHGFVLTIGAGGALTEIMNDTVSLLVPASRNTIITKMETLRTWPLLTGYRRGEPADVSAILDVVDAVQRFVEDHREWLEEIEINPLLCGTTRAVAADALIRMERKP